MIRNPLAAILALSLSATGTFAAETTWEPCGWGGGGFYYAAAFHPSRNGVIYLGGDVGGLYKTENGGRNWRMINRGLAGYGVFTIAVDPKTPDNLYAAVDQGLCKSTDAGENWTLLPGTSPKELHITGEKNKSIRSVAVDPRNSNIVYAATPKGKICKSEDGGQTWKEKYTVPEGSGKLRIEFGKVNGAYFGGIWTPLTFPAEIAAGDTVGFGFHFQGDGTTPKTAHVYLTCEGGGKYRSKNLAEVFANTTPRDLILLAADFAVDPEYTKAHPDKAASLPASPSWGSVKRVDFSCSGSLPEQQHVVTIGDFCFAATKTLTGKNGTSELPILAVAHPFGKDGKVQSYGNVRAGNGAGRIAYSVGVSPHDSKLIAAATGYSGIIMSYDGGDTWQLTNTPKRASSVAFDHSNANVIYASCFTEGIWKSKDAGKTWERLASNLPTDVSFREIAISPANSQDLYVIGQVGWGGSFFHSNDGGNTWTKSADVKADYEADPTLPAAGAITPLSIPTNIAINPLNPRQLYVSANWRPCLSDDGGVTWKESVRGADISCITDIRFSGDKTYVTAMDEGTLVSDDAGETWRQLWPLKHRTDLSGHNWRVGVRNIGGVDHLVSTASPWDAKESVVIVHSEDGGKTFKTTTEGIPTDRITANTMWGRGYPRALAIDPVDPNVIYLGIDGDPSGGKPGGGIFRSEDGGATWKMLPNQPASKRMYYGLAIDPTNRQRIYWAAFAENGGVHMTEDGGQTWKHVFKGDAYLFNLHVTADGTVYASGKQLYRSTDQGKTWTQVTKFDHNRSIVGLEVHPKDPNTIWISSTVWNGSADGGVFKSTDGGKNWINITGDIGYIRPQILRYNPKTNELWAGFVGLFKTRQ